MYGSIITIAYQVEVIDDHISPGPEIKDAVFFERKHFPWFVFSSHRKIVKDTLSLVSN